MITFDSHSLSLPTQSSTTHSILNYGTSSWGLYRHSLQSFFPEVHLLNPFSSSFLRGLRPLDAVLAWGNRPSTQTAMSLSHRYSAPLLRIEDGFLFGLEPGTSARMSLVVDDLGIYYDASCPSRLEALISEPLTSERIAHAQLVRDLWCEHGVSKYNHAPDWGGFLPSAEVINSCSAATSIPDEWIDRPFILLIDQTLGDQSVTGALANASSFSVMLDAALAQTATEDIVIKVHPEVASGRKKGYFDTRINSPLRANPRIHVLDQDVCLSSLISKARSIYTVSSQAGFEGLLWGKPVHTFGMPFYAGWGLTTDYLTRPTRRNNASLEQLTYGTLIAYSRYVNPHTKQLCQVEEIIQLLGLQRAQRQRFLATIKPHGFSWNKRRHLKSFLQGHQLFQDIGLPSRSSNDNITSSASDVVRQNTYSHLAWGSTAVNEDSATGIKFENLIRVEDGFIRSLGLGATLSRPYSWIFDQRGIYYDARTLSDLEFMLQNTVFDHSLTERAAALQSMIITLGMSKYNLPESKKTFVELAALKSARNQHSDKPIVLVIGQVESDASIRYGGVDIFTNADLLKVVRASNPDAFIVYKPHPDVVQTVRFNSNSDEIHRNVYDLIIKELSLVDCLEWVNEVHTISSLSGFEALIRNVPVTCYGLPFYAGWGLTKDRHTIARRSRKITLQELIAATLILYPTYIHPRSNLYCTPEDLIKELYLMKTCEKGLIRNTFNLIYLRLIQIIMGLFHRIRGI